MQFSFNSSDISLSLPPPLPLSLLLQMNKSLMDSREYEVGTDFVRFVTRNPEQMDELEDYLFEEFDPESEAESVRFPFSIPVFPFPILYFLFPIPVCDSCVFDPTDLGHVTPQRPMQRCLGFQIPTQRNYRF